MTTTTQLDERDQAIYRKRVDARERRDQPLVGDYVDFADGTTRRISHLWDDGPQTSDEGSFYFLHSGNMDFSGGLYGIVPFATLTLTEERRPGRAWFFHHDHRQAHNAVQVAVPCAVYTCSVEAPR